jgi:hypothetical protein
MCHFILSQRKKDRQQDQRPFYAFSRRAGRRELSEWRTVVQGGAKDQFQHRTAT